MKRFSFVVFICSLLAAAACQNNLFDGGTEPAAMRSTTAVRLNYRYEADVPAPDALVFRVEERDTGVQADFDANRPAELLDRTLASPDKRYVLAVYHNLTDASFEYRLDMYSTNGEPLRKMTSDAMAVHFPDTIVWSPDSGSLAFVAKVRKAGDGSTLTPLTNATPAAIDPAATPDEAIPAETPTPAPRTMAAPTGILTYRSEQIYVAAADGTNVKAITANEGLMYFYYAWSPDSSMVAALAATTREWDILDAVAASKGESMVPMGRLRVIEKNGRERRLDDNMTAVRPVWSPDSTKVATAFENQIRIYDAAGTNPTQAAIPLRNQLLISSQAYDREQHRLLQEGDANANVTPLPAEPMSTLPDPAELVSFNPIVELAWPSDDLLYLQTAYLKPMANQADSVRSFARWHRLVLSAQPAPAAK